jgi:hypothetical protein
MKRLLLTALVALMLSYAGTARAQFQPPTRPNYGPGYRPQLSPYLNLIRGGDPAANYYLGTLPEFQRRANAQMFSADISELDRRTLGNVSTLEQRIDQPLPGSGHPTAFGNTLSYFGASNPYAGGAPRAGNTGASSGQQRPQQPQQRRP